MSGIDESSPFRSVLKVDDEILEINGEKFSSASLAAKAIVEAAELTLSVRLACCSHAHLEPPT